MPLITDPTTTTVRIAEEDYWKLGPEQRALLTAYSMPQARIKNGVATFTIASYRWSEIERAGHVIPAMK